MDDKQLITVAHLRAFKEEILFELKTLIRSNNKGAEKRWIKSREVRKLLNVCPGTLQTMRKQKTIPFQKIGGTMYYDGDKINAMLEANKNIKP
ncbi:MAG: helix-turn-helix domain-containing protein [Sphingobacterium sp.]|jgi:hypothetical protein|nr:helix-turn-helix domain-containing protein [Sphingobacterium sp.]